LKRRSFTVVLGVGIKVRGKGQNQRSRSKSKVKVKVKGSGQECPLHTIALSGAYAGAEAPLFHGRARSCNQSQRQGQNQTSKITVKIKGRIKVKIKIKGSGQECPLHTIASFWWVFGDIRAIKNAALEAAFCFSTIRSVYHKAMVRTGRFAEDIFAFESGRYREFSGFCLLTGNS
jgi:hypothetical protein